MNDSIVPFNSKIEYLRVIVTHVCNLSCLGCHKEGQDKHGVATNAELIDAVRKCIAIGTKKIKLMGGEPTLRNDLDEIIRGIKKDNYGVDLSMVSNGLADVSLYEELFSVGLDRLNISVHGWNSKYFIENTRSNEKVADRFKENFRCLIEKNLISKVNYVIKKGINENDLFSMIDALEPYRDRVVIDVLNYLYDPGSESDKQKHYDMLEIRDLLFKRYGIIEEMNKVNQYSLDSTQLVLGNHARINLKTSELRKHNFLNSCKDCFCRDYCIEGISAIRLRTDLHLQPCLLRDDNTFPIPVCNGCDDELIEFLKAL